MKNGKKIKLRLFKELKICYGTIDYIDLKSIYISIQSWVEPKDDYTNWKKIVCSQSREIKHTIFENVDSEYFYDKSIVDLDIRYSGLNVDKKSFMNLEITLFTKPDVFFKSNDAKESIQELVKTVVARNIAKNKYFNFFITKKELV
jgi:hypothetical protein